MKMLEQILKWFPDDDLLKADGFDDAIIGIDDSSLRLIYSVKKCIDILIADGLTEDDAIDFFNFNTKCAWVGEKTPIWCNDDL